MAMLQRRQVFKKSNDKYLQSVNVIGHILYMGTRSDRYLIFTPIMHIIIILYS